jgi:hypothetical protein
MQAVFRAACEAGAVVHSGTHGLARAREVVQVLAARVDALRADDGALMGAAPVRCGARTLRVRRMQWVSEV